MTRIPPNPASELGSASPGAPADAAGPGGSFLDDLRASEKSADGVLPGKPRQRIPMPVIVGAVVILAGGVMLLGMRRYGIRSGMKFDTVKLEYTSQSSDAAVAVAHKRILEDLERSVAPADIPAERPAKNPFRLAIAKSDEPETMDAAAAEARRQAELSKQQIEQRRGEIDQAAGELWLHGIMDGRVPLARIGDQTVRVGDKVGEYFVVKVIEGRSVVLDGEGKFYKLTLGEARNVSAPKRAPAKSGPSR